ncbi:BON domain-containing protein [Burkholderia sp. SCN-KJ]|uniref:BON domain-containing protein n=1 Tax=Burkholderia sp. SCN-KJ TaxID=2969248 RepID=UPI0021502E32|nr:BON domain-containing protein [Burkholderia sp. SCN-KJ]MCR4470444.1 BON domain-containing protein [Burkholderia sp. SCN-KJ]
MDAINVIKQASGVLAVIVACNVYGQTSDTGAMTPAPMAAPSASSPRAANFKLEKNVRLALSKTKGVNVSGIIVIAKGGAVTLAGKVPDSGQADLATQAAQNVVGVTSVTNKLSIGEEGR